MAVEIYQIMINIGMGRVCTEIAYENLKTMLEDSFLLKDGKVHRVPFYNELLALNMMCSCLKRMERRNDAILVYEEIIKAVDESKINAKYQNNIISLVLANIDLYDSDKKWSDRGIAYELFCGKGKMLYMHFVSQIELVEDKENRRAIARLAYYLSDLFFRENNKQQIKEYYEQTYGEQLG